MFNTFAKIATAAVCSLMLTTLAVGTAVDGHAAIRDAAAATYASAGAETAHG